MLGWWFRKKEETRAEPAAPTPPRPAESVPAPAVDWAVVLADAQGDDEALLALARTAAVPLAIRQSAVAGLHAESALKQAEREFRGHDRRVHQAAKQRLQAVVAQRQARERAEQLLQTARSLHERPDPPVNRITELDRAWQALPVGELLQAQRDEFQQLSGALAERLRENVEREGRRQRWQAALAAALPPLRAACTACAQGEQDRAALAAAMAAANEVLRARPDEGTSGAEPLDALQRALHTAQALDDRLAVLERLLAAPDPAVAGDDGAALAEAHQAWRTLPPLADTALAASLQQRHDRWQQAREQALQARRSQGREEAREQERARRGRQAEAWVDALSQAEAALDDGRLAEAQRHLADIDGTRPASEVPEALQARRAAVQARLSQLRGWQQWAGGRAREELLLQAEALAAATPGGEPETAPEATVRPDVDPEVARLSVHQRADLIRTLRQRWKEIDDAGGAPAAALWRRFDAALVAAGAPVKAHFSARREARESNLAARQTLLDSLEAEGAAAWPSTDDGAPVEDPEAARRLAAALDRFRSAWRQLGPVEHTVPRPAQPALLARMEAVVARFDTPLKAVRARAAAQRQALVARARALAGGPTGHDLPAEARALQAEWQQQARQLPLARADEQSLWTEFRAALDAAFQAREAAHQAREAEFEGHAAARAALIERLRQQADDSPAALRRALAEADAEWRRCGPAPRARAAALDAEFRAACDGLRHRLNDGAAQAWRAVADALDAKRAMCADRERAQAEGGPPKADALASAWAALPALPPPLEAALRARAGLAPASPAAALQPPEVDELLLEMELAWDLPTPPAFEAARRARKLLAMKQSLEGRRASRAVPAPGATLARLLGASRLEAGQEERLAAVLAAWRRRGPAAGG